MPIEQIVVLALIQGITEFLPISSSGHLLLVPLASGWSDQGLIVDVMVHMGSFLAVLVYFWRDVLRLAAGGLALLRGRLTDDGRLALYIVAATVPAVAFGLVVKKTGLIDGIRTPQTTALVVGWNAIVFGTAMYVADRFAGQRRRVADMTLGRAMVVGLCQAVAIIPGTSRSGITITAGRAMGFERADAARFSFLLGIPAIAGAGVLVLGEAVAAGEAISTSALITGGLTFFTALGAIAFLMAVLRRYSLTGFVLYRLALGTVLLALAYGGAFAA